MKVGIFGVISHSNVRPMEVAVEIQTRGFESFFCGEHYHLPVSTPTPDFYDVIPDYYKYVPDPFQVLAQMSGVTHELTLGTSICLAPIHDTLILASRIGCLDMLSEGRAVIGVGVGWNAPELANHDVEFATRQDKLREQVLAMKQLWASESASYDGTHVKFTDSYSGPKPIQRPHPPIMLGGRPLKKNFRSIVEFCDGWMPTTSYSNTYGGDIAQELDTLNAMMREAGRDPKSLKNVMLVSEFGLFDRDPTQFAKDAPGRDVLAKYEQLGFDRVAYGVPLFSREHFLGALDHLERIASPWLSRRSLRSQELRNV